MASPNESLMKKSVTIASVVTAYWIVSISMVFLNKYLLSSNDVKLEAPIFITWYQCVVAVGVCYILGWLSVNIPDHFGMFPQFHINYNIALQILPLSFAFVGMIAFNNLCLKNVGVSFYNVGRSLTTVCNVILSYLFLGQSTSLKALLTCGVIICGFFLGVDQEDNSGDLSMLGVFFGISASICVALNSIYVKKVLPLVESNEWKLTLYNNFNATLLFIPVMVILGEVGEVSTFPKLLDLGFLVRNDSWWSLWSCNFYCHHFANQVYKPSYSQCFWNCQSLCSNSISNFNLPGIKILFVVDFKCNGTWRFITLHSSKEK